MATSTLRARAALLITFLSLLAISSPRSGADAADDKDMALRRLLGQTITPINAASFAVPTTTGPVTPLTSTAADIKTRPKGFRRHGNLCSSGGPKGTVHCHAKVLLANEYTGTDAPVAAAALKLAYHPDTDTLGPNNKPASIPEVSPGGRRLLAGGSVAYKPQQLQQVYLAGKAPTKCQTVAIVGAYHYANAQSDLNYYRAYYGLPALNVQFYDQNGGTSYAAANDGWAGEEMLDLTMVSALCPCCPIMYLGANDAYMNNLNAAIRTAVRLGARVVSMSWGGSEGDNDAADRSNFAFAGADGVVFTSSSGDDGFAGGTSYPASSAYVIGVGGTSLQVDSNNNRKTETVWSGAGSGCSQYISKPSWQTNSPGCTKRMVADVSAVADPNTGVIVYFKNQFNVYGGTSAAAPIIAALYGGGYLGSTVDSPPARGLYPGGQDYASLKDVTAGTNGPCSGSGYSPYYCNGVTGYDGPTGNGVPTSSGSGTTPNPTPNPTPSPTPTPTPNPTPSPSPSPAPSSTYSNMRLVTGQDYYGRYLCYGIQNSQVKQALCDNSQMTQSFTFTPTTGGWYYIKPASQNACVSVIGTYSGSSVVLQSCSGSSSQAFGFFDTDSTGTYFHLRPRSNSNLCLAVAGGSYSVGAVIQANYCSSTRAQTLFAYIP